MSERVAIGLRGNVGGFGVSSELTWNLVDTLQYHRSGIVSLGVGERALDIDYEHGSSTNQFKFDVLMSGPLLGLVFHF